MSSAANSSSSSSTVSSTAKDLLISNASDTVLIRPPHSLNGADFSIAECDRVAIFIADCTSQVTVDLVNDSILFFGPIEGSLFLRDCKNCRILAFCQQFRCRNVENCDIYLFCTTKSPIIESSHHLRFYPLCNLSYVGLDEHFSHAKLNPKAENYYFSIYDFTNEENSPEIPKPHFQVIKEIPKNIFLKFSQDEIAEMSVDNQFATITPTDVTQNNDAQWATPWTVPEAPPLANGWTFKRTGYSKKDEPLQEKPAAQSTVAAPAIFGELPALTVAFPVGTSAGDADAIMQEFTAELMERERSQSQVRTAESKEEKSVTTTGFVAAASAPIESEVSLAVNIDSSGQLYISTSSALSSSSTPVIVLVETHAPVMLKTETLDSLVSSALQMEVTEAAAHTTIKQNGSSSAPSSSPASPKLLGQPSNDTASSDDDWIKSHALYLHEDAVDDSALRRLDEIRAKYLEAKSAQEQSMKEAIRAIAQQQLADVAKFFESRRLANQKQNREEESKSKEEQAKKQERMLNGEMSEEESWSEIADLINLEKSGVRDEQDIDRIRGIYLALREKRKKANQARRNQQNTTTQADICHPVLQQLSADLLAVDAKNADASELKQMSLVEFQHYTAEELEVILQPLSRKQKLKYRALHQGKLTDDASPSSPSSSSSSSSSS